MTDETAVAVIGGGVVGVAVLHALTARGVPATLLEAHDGLGYAASGTNSGILHTGFDSTPGELETALIRRSASLRDAVLAALDVPVLRCGALLRPRGDGDRATVRRLAEGAHRNGVAVRLGEDGALAVPGESVTDPVAFTLALAAAAEHAGALVRTGARVESITPVPDGLLVHLEGGGRVRCAAAVNAAGLHADDVARLVGDDSFEVYPRKGEFVVLELPAGERLEQILLPVPTERTKGVLVFPTLDGRVVAGPTAIDGEDKDDWSVRPQAAAEVLERARAVLPAVEGARVVATYAGLRPAGRGSNYVIGPSPVCPRLVHAAAIRSTGLSASLGIGAHVAELLVGALAGAGVEVGEPGPLPAAPPGAELLQGPAGEEWWRRTARWRAGGAARARAAGAPATQDRPGGRRLPPP